MPSYYKKEAVKSGFKVQHGLDPRSCYPRCDFCSTQKTLKGTVQVGRWWSHETCSRDLQNLALASAQLPKLDYRRFLNRGDSGSIVHAMRVRLAHLAKKQVMQFADLMAQRGSALMGAESPTEYL